MKVPIKKNITQFFIFTFFILLNLSQINSNFINKINPRLLSTTDDRTEGPNQNCLLIKEDIRYELTSLSSELRNVTDEKGNSFFYQFCKNINDTESSVIYKSENKNITYKLAGSVYGEKNSKNKISVQNNTMTIHLSEGEKCAGDESKKYDFTIILTCNEGVKFNLTEFNEDDPSSTCEFKLNAISQYACGEEGLYFDFSLTKRIIAGIILIIVGNIIGIFGYRYLYISFYITCILGFPILLIYIFIYLLDISDKVLYYVLLSIGAILGFLVAFFLTKKKKVFLSIFMAILGGAFGYLIGTFLYEIIFLHIQTGSQKTMYIIILACCMVIGVILGIFAPRKICIISTSTIGGYSFMRGISLFLQETDVKYIDENKIFDYARTENFEQIKEMISGYFFLYPVLFVLFTVVYLFVQHKINPKSDDVDDYKELESKFLNESQTLRIDTSSSFDNNQDKIMDDD